MRTVEEIEYQIKVIEAVKKEYVRLLETSKPTRVEWWEDNIATCNEKIALLQWVLGLKDSPNT